MDFSEEAVRQAKARAAAARLPLTAVVDDLDHFDVGRSKWDLIALFYMHAWFHESTLNVPERLTAAIRPGGLLVIESYASDKGDYQTNELLRSFGALKIVHYAAGYLFNSSTISAATARAFSSAPGSKLMAPTRACPPPP